MVPGCSEGEPFELAALSSADGATCLRLAGELDVASIAVLERLLAPAISAGDDVVLDCSRLTFIDAGGLAALLVAHRAAIRAGGSLRVDDPTPEVARTFHLARLGFLLADRAGSLN